MAWNLDFISEEDFKKHDACNDYENMEKNWNRMI